MFHVIEKELNWRREQGQLEGFESMKASKPVVAVGAENPLEDQMMMTDYFRTYDASTSLRQIEGLRLSGQTELMDWLAYIQAWVSFTLHRSVFLTNTQHPHLTPEHTWERLFETPPPDTIITDSADTFDQSSPEKWFTPSLQPAHKETLRILRENEPNTVSIVAIGPLTNLALAAAEDPETFLRAKEVVVMGGAVDLEGNVRSISKMNALSGVLTDPLRLRLLQNSMHLLTQ